MSPSFSKIFSQKMAICAALGFSSGLPLYFLLNLIPAWLTSEGVDLKKIGFFALVQFPYTWKFLWSPFLDRFSLLGLGRRRGWSMATQAGLLGLIALFSALNPKEGIYLALFLSSLLALFSATQDIALDAYRREFLSEDELGLGNSIHVNAYRIAGLIPGSLSLILADRLPWSLVFLITALFMIPGMVVMYWVKEPKITRAAPKNLREAVTEPFLEFIRRQGWQSAVLMLSFIFLYKLGDSLCTALATPFYLAMGFSKTDIGLIAKHAGLWPAITGALLGGLWMMRLGIFRALWVFGVVQMGAILGFVYLASVAPFESIGAAERWQLAAVIGFEAFGVGLGTAAFVAFIAKTTHPAYTATQFALFTSLAAVPRTFINASAGVLVKNLGWVNFFELCALLALPGMVLLYWVAPWKGEKK